MTDRTEQEIARQIGYERATFGFCRQDLSALGEREVRYNLNSGKHGHEGIPVFHFVSAWLKDAEFERLSDSSAKRDAREEETLSIAKEALSEAKAANDIARPASFAATAAAAAASEANVISRSNRRIAITAAIIAAIAAIAAIVAAIAAVNGVK